MNTKVLSMTRNQIIRELKSTEKLIEDYSILFKNMTDGAEILCDFTGIDKDKTKEDAMKEILKRKNRFAKEVKLLRENIERLKMMHIDVNAENCNYQLYIKLSTFEQVNNQVGLTFAKYRRFVSYLTDTLAKDSSVH